MPDRLVNLAWLLSGINPQDKPFLPETLSTEEGELTWNRETGQWTVTKKTAN